MKAKIIIIAIASFALGAILYQLASPVIFQEGNPWPEIRGIAQLFFGKENIVKLSGADGKYLTRSKGGFESADSFLKNKGYELADQMGSGYYYKSSAGSIVMTRRQFSRFYIIWTVSENKSYGMAEKLKECMPKSDTASHERCSVLLKQITDYDSCVLAGLSILKSNPPQCVTPDGRAFVQAD